MHIPSRVQVLSWNENQVADLLREHRLLDCVDCVFQRHIDGQKLLNLREGDVMYFLEIHDKKSRGKFWDIVKQITEKKGGVQSLMNKFQDSPEQNNIGAVEEDLSDDSEDSFDSDDDYDEPDPDQDAKPSISLERQETIRRNLLSLTAKSAPQPQVIDHDEYPEPEDIYDVPEDGYGEPDEDMYDVPSDESGGGVVGRHSALERKESENYLVPDDRKLVETQDEEDYEDLSGAPPIGHSELDEQDDYVVPDTKPTAIVPPRPPKTSSNNKPLPIKKPLPDNKPLPNNKPLSNNKPLPNNKPFPNNKPLSNNIRLSNNQPLPPRATDGGSESRTGRTNLIQKLQAKFQEPENYEPPQPQRGLKKPWTAQPPKPTPPSKEKPRAAVQPIRMPMGIENKKAPDTPVEPEQDEYEFPELPSTVTKSASNKPAPVPKGTRVPTPPSIKKPPSEPEQETYEPPDQPPRPIKKPQNNKKPPAELQQEMYEPPDQPPRPSKKPANNKKPPPIEPEQETYEPPDEPPRFGKKPASKKPPMIMEQENYEPPETPARRKKVQPAILEQENYEPPELPSSKPTVCMDPEENYEAPDQMNLEKNECVPEDYEVPDRCDIPPKEEPNKSPKKYFNPKKFFHGGSKKNTPNVPAKLDKNKTIKKEVPKSSSLEHRPPPARQPPNPVGKSLFGKKRGDKSVDRNSMALPSLPTDNVDSRSLASELPSLPPKPSDNSGPKEKPVPERRIPEIPKSKPPPIKPAPKSKQQRLNDQPWFHGSISKEAVCDKLRKAKQDGAYLVRNSSRDPGKCIMSIFYKNDIRHLNIPCDSNGHYRLGDSGVEKFKDVEELVTYFNKHDVEFSAGGKTPLTFACLKS